MNGKIRTPAEKKALILEIKRLRESGQTYREIGAHFGFSAIRARSFFLDSDYYSQPDPEGLLELTGRARNSLWRLAQLLWLPEFKTKAQVKEAMLSGKLHPSNIRWYGWSTHTELANWCGVPVEQVRTRPRICPHCGKAIFGKRRK